VHRAFTAVVRDEDLKSVKFKIQLYAIWYQGKKTKQNVDGFLLSKRNSHYRVPTTLP
jgi:hypothetical protein